jgi:hypothetical protein
MKRKLQVVFLVASVVLFVVAGSAIAGNSLDGLWGGGGPDSSVIISQDGNDVYLTVYVLIDGEAYVQHGQGKRAGNNVTFSLKTTSNVKKWPLTQEYKATVSGDGNSISGTNTNKLGTSPFTWTKKTR